MFQALQHTSNTYHNFATVPFSHTWRVAFPTISMGLGQTQKSLLLVTCFGTKNQKRGDGSRGPHHRLSHFMQIITTLSTHFIQHVRWTFRVNPINGNSRIRMKKPVPLSSKLRPSSSAKLSCCPFKSAHVRAEASTSSTDSSICQCSECLNWSLCLASNSSSFSGIAKICALLLKTWAWWLHAASCLNIRRVPRVYPRSVRVRSFIFIPFSRYTLFLIKIHDCFQSMCVLSRRQTVQKDVGHIFRNSLLFSTSLCQPVSFFLTIFTNKTYLQMCCSSCSPNTWHLTYTFTVFKRLLERKTECFVPPMWFFHDGSIFFCLIFRTPTQSYLVFPCTCSSTIDPRCTSLRHLQLPLFITVW